MMQAQLPSGLAALMPQRAPQIPPDLLALMQQTQTLKQVSQPVVPETGQPTVAAQAAEAAEQMVQPPQDNSPPGMEELMPGVQQRAMEMAQAAQPATQGDIQRAMAQRNPMQRGIGGLPGDVAPQGMAEGGVVGYAGPDGSKVEVDESELSVSERVRRSIARALERREASKRMLSPQADMPAAAPEAAQTPETAPRASVQMTPQQREVFTPPNFTQAPPPAPADRKRAASTQAAAPAAPAPLMGPAVPSGSERQFAEALAAQARMELPPERTAQQIRLERENFYRSLGIEPDFATKRMSRIEAQEARDQAEAAERAKQVKDRGLENLISRLVRVGGAGSLFRGLGQAQLGMEPILAAQRLSDERFSAVMRERQVLADRERTAIEDMQRALADGDISRAEKSRDIALAARNAKNAAEADIRAKFAPQLLQAETAAADRASREKEAAAGRAAQLEAARIGADRTPAEVRLMEWLRNPENKKLYESIQSSKRAEDRNLKLYEIYMKNKLLLGDMSFETFAAGLPSATGASGAGAGEFKVLSSRPKQ